MPVSFPVSDDAGPLPPHGSPETGLRHVRDHLHVGLTSDHCPESFEDHGMIVGEEDANRLASCRSHVTLGGRVTGSVTAIVVPAPDAL